MPAGAAELVADALHLLQPLRGFGGQAAALLHQLGEARLLIVHDRLVLLHRLRQLLRLLERLLQRRDLVGDRRQPRAAWRPRRRASAARPRPACPACRTGSSGFRPRCGAPSCSASLRSTSEVTTWRLLMRPSSFSMNCRRAPTRVSCASSSAASSPRRVAALVPSSTVSILLSTASIFDSSSGVRLRSVVARSPNASSAARSADQLVAQLRRLGVRLVELARSRRAAASRSWRDCFKRLVLGLRAAAHLVDLREPLAERFERALLASPSRRPAPSASGTTC